MENVKKPDASSQPTNHISPEDKIVQKVKEYAIKAFLLISGAVLTAGVLYMFSEAHIVMLLPFLSLSRWQVTVLSVLVNAIAFTICRAIITKSAQAIIEKTIDTNDLSRGERQIKLFNVCILGKDAMLACDIACFMRIAKTIFIVQNPIFSIAGHLVSLELILRTAAIFLFIIFRSSGSHYLRAPCDIDAGDKRRIEDITSEIYPKLSGPHQTAFASHVMNRAPEVQFTILDEAKKKHDHLVEIRNLRKIYEQALSKKDEQIQELKDQLKAFQESDPSAQLARANQAKDEAIRWHEHVTQQLNESKEKSIALENQLREKPKAEPEEITKLRQELETEKGVKEHFRQEYFKDEEQINRLEGECAHLRKQVKNLKNGFVLFDSKH